MHNLDYVYFIHKANLLKKKPLKSHSAAIHSILWPPKYLVSIPEHSFTYKV